MDFKATLVVMAAGMGSRFGGLKQVEPIGPHGQALLDFSVYDALAAGFTDVVFVIKHAIEEDFKNTVGSRIEKVAPVTYVFQETDVLPKGYVCPPDREKPWGTGHAVYCCKDVVKNPFAVINADDYYGKDAFKKIYGSLKSGADEYCMVGFRLANTLTENGTVSRGVCETENGYLKCVTERTKIKDCCYYDGEKKVELSPDTVVSMNMWGFMPDFFSYTERDLKKFLDEKINVPKSEFYLPFIVADMIEKGEKKVRVLVAEEKWYGVTYKEDKNAVITAMKEKIESGEYKGF